MIAYDLISLCYFAAWRLGVNQPLRTIDSLAKSRTRKGTQSSALLMTAMSNPLILAIETATRAGSVAVSRGAEVLAHAVGDPSVSHSTNLIEMVDGVLQETGFTLADVDVFAVAVGPGSFTGLRIGLATVKAFAECNDRPIVGVSTLAAVAHATGVEGDVVSLLPAGRGEVFAQLFSICDGVVKAKDDAAHLSPAETLSKYGEGSDIQFAGDGTRKLVEYLEQSHVDLGDETARRINSSANQTGFAPLANSVAALALKDFREGKSVKPEELHAVYVRPSDAEINEQWQQQKQQSQAQT
jgi:tRNA threonylcarbamoyladenosine biosynthesis protein TsaB